MPERGDFSVNLVGLVPHGGKSELSTRELGSELANKLGRLKLITVDCRGII